MQHFFSRLQVWIAHKHYASLNPQDVAPVLLQVLPIEYAS